MKPLSHDRIQQEIYQYCWNTYPQSRRTMWHTPNEFHRPKGMTHKEHMIILAQRNAIGVLPGVTDLVLYHQGTIYMFDIKIGSDSLSQNQQDFIKAMEAQGGQFYEINSLEQGKSIIDSIFLT